jgi:23S rRNA (uracil1939-C5)-methyltransferase
VSEILRIAAKGDGVTADGRHVPLTAPGDVVNADGSVRHGPHHAEPPCRHFGKCGGCQLQHLGDTALAGFVSDRVVNAAEGQGLVPQAIGETHLSPPYSRRRASLRAVNGGTRPLIGFREEGSHRVVGLAECHVLRPELFALLTPLGKLLKSRRDRYAADIELTLVDQGVDLAIKGLAVEGLEATEALLDFAREQGFARLTVDQGYGPEAMWEPSPVTVTLGGVAAGFPPGAFLQATADGEKALVSAACEWLHDVGSVVDLFAGLGTFAFALAGEGRKLLAVEGARELHLACKSAAGSAAGTLAALHRDLFRNPLRADELKHFEAAVLDPPRAGAREQVLQLAESGVGRIAYISCNPSSWARDARVLADAGYSLAELRPVGQFRWSTHVELASLFLKD